MKMDLLVPQRRQWPVPTWQEWMIVNIKIKNKHNNKKVHKAPILNTMYNVNI